MTGQAAGHVATAYLQHGQFSTAIVTGAGLPTDFLQLALTPAATIFGRVVDENGDPVPHAIVTLFQEDKDGTAPAVRPTNSDQVDDKGDYFFGRLLPGRYFLAASGVPWYAVHPPPTRVEEPYAIAIDPALDVAYPTVFYPAALSSEGASPIDLAGGEQVPANLQLVPQHAVTLTLQQPAGVPPNGPPPQLTQTIFGLEQPVQAQVQWNGSAQVIQGVAPGRYSLNEFSPNGNRPPIKTGTVDLTSGSVVRDLSPRPASTSVTLHVRSASGAPLPRPLMVMLVAPEPAHTVGGALNDKGDFEFPDVTAGNFRLAVAGKHGPLSITAVEVNGQPVRDSHLHVTGSGSLTGSLTVGGPLAVVEGFVRRAGKPAAACHVLLIPAGADTDVSLFRRDQSDLDGSFSLPGVAPGKYLLVALEDAWSLPWSNLHVLEPYLLHAQPVVIPPDAHGTIQLREPITPQPLR